MSHCSWNQFLYVRLLFIKDIYLDLSWILVLFSIYPKNPLGQWCLVDSLLLRTASEAKISGSCKTGPMGDCGLRAKVPGTRSALEIVHCYIRFNGRGHPSEQMGTFQRNAWGGESDRWQNKGQWPTRGSCKSLWRGKPEGENLEVLQRDSNFTLQTKFHSIFILFLFLFHFLKLFIYLFESRERRKHHSPSDSLPKYLQSLATMCQAVDQNSLKWWGPHNVSPHLLPGCTAAWSWNQEQKRDSIPVTTTQHWDVHVVS